MLMTKRKPSSVGEILIEEFNPLDTLHSWPRKTLNYLKEIANIKPH
jgi:hypothetical protein